MAENSNTPPGAAEEKAPGATGKEPLQTDFFERELSRLRGELEQVSGDRDGLARQLHELVRRGKVSELASQYRFSDPDYLAFLCEKHEIDLDSPEATANFMSGLEKTCPKLFRAELFSGVPRHPSPHRAPERGEADDPVPRSGGGVSNPADRLVGLLENAPELA